MRNKITSRVVPLTLLINLIAVACAHGGVTYSSIPGLPSGAIPTGVSGSVVVGYWHNEGFYDSNGDFVPVNDPTVPLNHTTVLGISGNLVLGYGYQNGVNHMFEYNISTSAYTPVVIPNEPSARPICFSGNEIFFYSSTQNAEMGFDGTNEFSIPSYPGAAQTTVSAVAGTTIAGWYLPQIGGPGYGFLDRNGSFTSFSDPNTTYGTLVTGTDGSNVVGTYSDANGSHGFVFEGTHYTTLDDPAGETFPTAVYGSTVVGYVSTLNGNGYQPFEATLPEPGGLIIAMIGGCLMGLVRIRR